MLRILILPGDGRSNLGDTAILHGVVEMLRGIAPTARLAVGAPGPGRREGLDDVRFVSGPGFALLAEAARADLVVWGGGQLLQGNRSRVKIPLWALRIGALRLLGRPIVGIGQGVGPLPRKLDRRLAAWAVRATRGFSVRDAESARLLEGAGVPADRRLVAADPALLWAAARDPAPRVERSGTGRQWLGMSLRWTAHHRPGRWVPVQWLPVSTRDRALKGGGVSRFRDRMVSVARRLLDELDVGIRLFPMYRAPWETDCLLAEGIADGVGRPDRVEVVGAGRSPREVLDELRRLEAFVGVPMHSTLLATSQGVPTLALPYEPKGTDYMEHLGQSRRVHPLLDVLADGGDDRLVAAIRDLWEARDGVRSEICRRIPKMRESARRGADPVRSALGMAANVEAGAAPTGVAKEDA